MGFKKKVYCLLFLSLLSLISLVSKIEAQATSLCGSISEGPPKATGLVSAPKLSRNFATYGGACIVDSSINVSLDTYPSSFLALKSLYYERAKQTNAVTIHPAEQPGDKTLSNLSMPPGTQHLYYIQGNLAISSKISGTESGLVFVDGDVNIGPYSGNQLSCNDDNFGLVFIVKGNVYIHKDVTQVDGVFMSEGTICTASYIQSDGTRICPSNYIIAPQLIINGSLVSLNPANKIQFRRTLVDNNLPAEVINHQVKYLVLMRNLMFETPQLWSEIDASVPIPPAAPHVPAAPPPTSTSACDDSKCHLDVYANACNTQYLLCASNAASFKTNCPTQCNQDDIYGYNGIDCDNHHLICAGSAASQTLRYGPSICGANDYAACDPLPGDAPAPFEGRRQYYTGASCDSLATCDFPGEVNCELFCHDAIQTYAGDTCTKTKSCAANWVAPTSCDPLTGGCTTAQGGSTQATYTENDACKADQSHCTISSTAWTCPVCYTGPIITYHDANSCSSTLSCPHNYLDGGIATTCPSCYTGATTLYRHDANSCTLIECPRNYNNGGVSTQSSCNYCGGVTTYVPANSCPGTTVACPTNYLAATAVAPACRETAFPYSNGSQCAYDYTTYPANCNGTGQFCRSNGTDCYLYSTVIMEEGGGPWDRTGDNKTTWHWSDVYDDKSKATGTIGKIYRLFDDDVTAVGFVNYYGSWRTDGGPSYRQSQCGDAQLSCMPDAYLHNNINSAPLNIGDSNYWTSTRNRVLKPGGYDTNNWWVHGPLLICDVGGDWQCNSDEVRATPGSGTVWGNFGQDSW